MNCTFLSWNVRGLGKPEKIRAVLAVMAKSKASVVFIQESNVQKINPQQARRLTGSRFKLVYSSSNGASGGQITIWNSNAFWEENSMILDRFIASTCILMQVKERITLI
ncbi:hypothetical protein HRI_000333900 [Hibiscus trionum]|uniref:Endonuclease/exonuclease/phosphatase domain-containing protein n=1 Tax=Hibiscus trionum TaxID=183268 RepID=A0A9W7GXH9_HIBTR|nr:hypothetical protein HRI_000333900 [Hibiscus trionum]